MDVIVTSLEPHQGLIGIAAIYLATAVHLSGFSTCRKIVKNGSTNNVSSLIFATNVMMGLIKYRTGIILNDYVILGINTSVIVLNTIWAAVYYIYAKDKWNEIIKQFSVCVAVAAIMWRYTEWEDPTLVKFRYGLTGTILTLSLMISPAVATKDIIKNKDASQLSLLWTFLSVLFAFSTILYSSVRNIRFMFIQSVAAFFLSSLRLIIIFVYPRKPVQSDKKNK